MAVKNKTKSIYRMTGKELSGRQVIAAAQIENKW